MRPLLLFISIITICSCNSAPTDVDVEICNSKIAFLSDVHFQDIYGEFSDSEYRGVKHPETGRYVIARTMESQLHSTRLFNENYFALLAALDNIVDRGVKYIVLPGDLTDDGQPFNVRGLKKIFDRYSEEYGVKFFATTGNHDPNRPFLKSGGKMDFIGEGGAEQPIVSSIDILPSNLDHNSAVVTSDVANMGYRGIVNTLNSCGFFPLDSYIYWETPFSTYEYSGYNFNEALEQSKFSDRHFSMPPYGSSIPDVSYLVEPEEGLWLLAIDANVYLPTKAAQKNPKDPKSYKSAGNGYKDLLTHKKFLINWIQSVAKRADELGKTLITFSHYPMVDFNDNASTDIANFIGSNKMQLHRVPSDIVSETFADIGVKVHFAGHMHINDTGIFKSEKGNNIVNIQVPSLAAYTPAYKLLSFQSANILDIQTIVIDSIPRFNELFPIYREEYNYLKSSGSETWNSDILNSKDYREFTSFHLKGLVESRLKRDWPESIDSKMLFELFRVRSADELAFDDIDPDILKEYKARLKDLKEREREERQLNQSDSSLLEFLNIFDQLISGSPADHFTVDLNSSEVKRLKR